MKDKILLEGEKKILKSKWLSVLIKKKSLNNLTVFSTASSLARGVNHVQQGLFLPSQGEMSQAKKIEREGAPQLHHKSPKLRGQEPASFIIFGSNSKTAKSELGIEKRNWSPAQKISDTYIEPSPETNCDDI